jgi:hypothetical protein
MTISRDNWISINLNELVSIRASFLGEEMSEGEVEDLASELRVTLSFDTMFGMIDESIWDYLDMSDKKYGQIETGVIPESEFEMVKLTSYSWEIEVPIRKKK